MIKDKIAKSQGMKPKTQRSNLQTKEETDIHLLPPIFMTTYAKRHKLARTTKTILRDEAISTFEMLIDAFITVARIVFFTVFMKVGWAVNLVDKFDKRNAQKPATVRGLIAIIIQILVFIWIAQLLEKYTSIKLVNP